MCDFGYYTSNCYGNYGYGYGLGYNYYGYQNPMTRNFLSYSLGYALGSSIMGGYGYGCGYNNPRYGYSYYSPYIAYNYGGYGCLPTPQVGYNPYALSNTTFMSYSC